MTAYSSFHTHQCVPNQVSPWTVVHHSLGKDFDDAFLSRTIHRNWFPLTHHSQNRRSACPSPTSLSFVLPDALNVNAKHSPSSPEFGSQSYWAADYHCDSLGSTDFLLLLPQQSASSFHPEFDNHSHQTWSSFQLLLLWTHWSSFRPALAQIVHLVPCNSPFCNSEVSASKERFHVQFPLICAHLQG